jgi:gluconate 2-dehydrogenase gamma chain
VADASLVSDALAFATQRAKQPGPHEFAALSAAQAMDLEAVAMRIFPSDGTPGAQEAGVIHFIDRSLTTFAAGQKPLFDEGLADLVKRADRKWRGTASFASLAADRQDELLRDIEQSAFFQAVRFSTIVGMFALPSWGGNRDHAGWTMLGMEHQPAYQAPFGYYDANPNVGR